LLLERAVDAVTREELLKRIWPSDTFVDFEHGLNTAIKELRGALSDSASEPRYIETLPKLGYRVISPVEAVAGAVAGVGVKGAGEKPEPAVAGGVGKEAEAVSREPAGPRRWRCAGLVIGAVIVAGLLAL
jgi:DNA-binding winged helix-turn-helix (wHTH) protein